MAGLKIKDKDGKWVGIPTIQGEPGPRGIPGKDGRDGVDGKNGINGKTPVKGVDYFTEEDKQEFIDEITEKHDKDIIDIESYLDILTPKSSAKGELVHITDALPLATFETTTDGNVEQETTRGVNILNWNRSGSETSNGITRTYITPTEINFKGKVENKSNAIFGISLGTLEAGTYTISFTNHDSTKLHYLISNVGNISSNYKTFTLSEIGDRYLQVFCDTEDTIDITIKFQLEKGNTATEWEKYTGGQASPNPEFPSEIEVIEGDLSFKVNGKNLLDIDKVTKGKFINADGTILTNLNWNSYLIPIKVFSNRKYTISRNENEVGKYQFVIAEYDKNGQLVKNNDYYNNGTYKYTITTSENTSFVYLGYRVDFEHSDLQFELGDKRTTFEPYQEQIVYLDLKGNWVGAINDDIKDYLVTDKKKYWLVKNVGKVVLDGSENWKQSGVNPTVHNILVNNFKAPITSDIIATNLVSSHFKTGATYNQLTNKDEYYNIVGATSDSYISFKYKETTSIASWKTWLSENNVELYYELLEPQIIELGELPEPIKTFEGTNNIQLLANLDTEIEVKYALDLQKKYDNKIASLSNEII